MPGTKKSILKKWFQTIVLQTNTNIDVNNALMDTKKHLNEYRKEWFDKVEKVSENHFNIAKKLFD